MFLLNEIRFVLARRVALLVLVLAGCAGPAAGVSNATVAMPRAVRVTFLLFSGRPNPSFDLDPAVAAARLVPALEATKTLEAAAGDSASPGVLGYNGIVVENGADVRGLPRVMIVYHDRVEVRDGKTALRQDAGRQLEATLVELALEKRAIDEKMLRWMEQK